MRSRLGTLVLILVLVAMTLLPVAALALDIDATALTSPTFRITPYSPLYVSNATVQSFALSPGTYAFSDEANGAFSFDVDAAGLVSYAPSFESFLDGAGTTTLTVRGFDVSFDATALTCPTFRISHVTAFLPTTSVQNATMLPLDFYGLDDTGSNQIVFHLDYDGHFQLVPGSEDYLFGAGTSTLTIRGFDFTVDATALASPTFRLLGHSPIIPTSVVQGFTGIPGAYLFFDVSSNNFLFNVDADGRIQVLPANAAFTSGAGTSELLVSGFTFHFDVCGLAPLAAQFNISGHMLDGASTSTPHTLIGIPGPGYFLVSAGDLLFFTIDAGGNFSDLQATFLGIPVGGAGTNTLHLGSCVTTGTISGQVTAECPSAGTPLLGVHADAYAVGSGDLAASVVTDASGNYTMADVPAGAYSVAVVVPLGYTASSDPVPATVTGGQTATVSFTLACQAIASTPRTIGFWMHQVGVATGGNGHAQVSASALCSYLDLIEAHFNSNVINQVIVYQPAPGATCADKLLTAKTILNLQGATPMIRRAKQQLMALLLNVAAGYISQTAVISADGATVSQAITFCDQTIDNPLGNYEKVKTIADLINNGTTVPAGMIPLSTAQIAYRRGMEAASFRVLSNSTAGAHEFRFTTVQAGTVRLAIHDVAGRLVSTVVSGSMAAGAHSVTWDGRTVSGARAVRGIYFARLETPREAKALKIVETRGN
jgi:FlgD Ig-like domain/Carboxypeptidase regulatory-like domain